MFMMFVIVALHTAQRWASYLSSNLLITITYTKSNSLQLSHYPENKVTMYNNILKQLAIL